MKTPNWLQKRWIRRLLIGVVGLYVIYVLAGFLLLPPVVKWLATGRGAEALGMPVRLDAFRFNPLTFRLGVDGLAIGGGDQSTAEEATELAGLEALALNFDPMPSLFTWSVRVDSLEVRGLRAEVVVLPGGESNMDPLLEKLQGIRIPTPPAALRDGRITGARLKFRDTSVTPAFETQFHPIAVTLTNFATWHTELNPVQIRIEGSGGEEVEVDGGVRINPLAAQADFNLRGARPGHYAAYLKAFFGGEIRGGELAMAGDFGLGDREGQFDLYVRDVEVTLRDLAIGLSGGEEDPVVSVPRLEVTTDLVSLRDQAVKVARVATTGGRLRARRSSSGEVDLLTLFPAAPAEPDASVVESTTGEDENKGPAEAKPWAVAVNRFEMSDYGVRFEDAVPREEVMTEIDQMGVEADKITLEKEARFPVKISARINQSADFKVEGDVGIQPVQAGLQLRLNGLQLPVFQPYAGDRISGDLVAGVLSVDAKAELKPTDQLLAGLGIETEVRLENLDFQDPVTKESAIQVGALRVGEARVQPEPLQVDAAVLELRDSRINLVRAEDGALNIAALFQAKEKASGASGSKADAEGGKGGADAGDSESKLEPGETSGELPQVSLNRLAITNLVVQIADLSVEPDFSTAIQDFSGSITELDLGSDQAAPFDFSAVLQSGGRVHLQGELLPQLDARNAHVQVTIESLALPAFSPYARQAIGNPVEEGALSMDLDYSIKADRLDAQNKLVFDDLVLGARAADWQGTGLPVRLAVALLKDQNGEIQFNIPLNGDLSNPQFQVGQIIVETMFTMVREVVASPFKLLGRIAGMGEANLSHVSFAAGTASLDKAAEKVLQGLADALQKRPQLTLTLTPTKPTDADRKALLDQQFQAALQQYQSGATLSREDLILQAYRDQFGMPETRESPMPGPTTQAESQSAESEKRPGKWKRFVNRYVLFWRDDEVPEPAEEEQSPLLVPEEIGESQAPAESNPDMPSAAEMERKLRAAIELPPEALSNLTTQRVENVREFLVDRQGLPDDRITVTEAPAEPAQEGRVEFGLQ